MKDIIKNWFLKRHIKKFGSKNNGYFNYFVINWAEYKPFVLHLINHKNYLIRCWGRHKFRIDQDKEGKGREVSDILPNGYFLTNADGNKTFIVRTHCKYAKRLYYGFLPIWWMLHLLDWLIQTWNPEFSFGFDTLTAYPDAHPETNTVDGFVRRFVSDSTWTDVRDGNGTYGEDNGSAGWMCCLNRNGDGTYGLMQRSIFLFNTSSLDDNAVISEANISVYKSGGATDSETPDYHIAASNPDSNTAIISSDYQNISRTSFGYLNHNSFTMGGYSAITLNSDGKSNISKTSVSKFSAQMDFDINNSDTFNVGETTSTSVYFADETGITRDPKLVVTFTLPYEWLSGTIAGVAATSLALKADKKLAGSSAGVATAQVSLQVGNFLPLAPAEGIGATALVLKADKKMAMQSAGIATAQMSLKADKKLAGSSAGIGYAVAHLGAFISIAGESHGEATAEMNLLEANYMQLSSQGNSSAQLSLKVTRKLQGTSAGTSTAVSDLRIGSHILTLENAG